MTYVRIHTFPAKKKNYVIVAISLQNFLYAASKYTASNRSIVIVQENAKKRFLIIFKVLSYMYFILLYWGPIADLFGWICLNFQKLLPS